MSADCAPDYSKRPSTVPSFRAIYKEQCNNFYMCSRRTLLSKIPCDASIDLCVDIIRADEWKPLLQALRVDKSLEAVTFKSSFLSSYPELIADVGRLQLVQKMQRSIRLPALFTPDMLKLFCSALSEHIKNNTSLRSLELVGFPFSLVHLQELSVGIRASSSIASLTFDGSSLGKQGVEVLCHALCERQSVRVLSLCNCRLGKSEADLLAWFLRQQSLGRQSELWQGVLRCRALALDSLCGLRRLSLCRNPLGDAGICSLADALTDNLCLRALDLQSCHAGSVGASALLNLLGNNIVLEVVDIRQNPNIDADLARDIAEKVSSNRLGRRCEYDVLPLGQPLLCHQERSRSTGKLQERKTGRTKWKPRSSSLGRDVSKPPLHVESSPSLRGPHNYENRLCFVRHAEEELHRCQESLRKEQEARQVVERKLLELFEENRQLRSQQCKGCQQLGYSLVPDSLLKDIEQAFVKFQVLMAFYKHRHMGLTEPQAARQSSLLFPRQAPNALPRDSFHSGRGDDSCARKDSTGDPSTHSRPLLTHSPAATVASKPPVPSSAKPFQELVRSRAKLSVSERTQSSSTADSSSTSSTTRRKDEQGLRKHTTGSVKAEESLQSSHRSNEPSNALATPLESSKRLSELLGIDQVPSKLMPSTLGSPGFLPMETFDSEAGLSKNASNSLVVSALSGAREKSATLQKLNTVEWTPARSSHESTLMSSIQEELASTSYKQPAAAVASNNGVSSNQQGLHSEESDTLSLSEMPSKSFNIHTADMTISSIHSTMKHEKASRLSLRNSQQRHSTPTFSHTASQGAEVISTPSNVSLSQNQSEKSTPSTPDTASPPQLVGSDLDGF